MDAALARSRAVLGDRDFDLAWDSGRRLHLEQAIELATAAGDAASALR